jgi:hypothetical protein
MTEKEARKAEWGRELQIMLSNKDRYNKGNVKGGKVKRLK